MLLIHIHHISSLCHYFLLKMRYTRDNQPTAMSVVRLLTTRWSAQVYDNSTQRSSSDGCGCFPKPSFVLKKTCENWTCLQSLNLIMSLTNLLISSQISLCLAVCVFKYYYLCKGIPFQ